MKSEESAGYKHVLFLLLTNLFPFFLVLVCHHIFGRNPSFSASFIMLTPATSVFVINILRYGHKSIPVYQKIFLINFLINALLIIIWLTNKQLSKPLEIVRNASIIIASLSLLIFGFFETGTFSILRNVAKTKKLILFYLLILAGCSFFTTESSLLTLLYIIISWPFTFIMECVIYLGEEIGWRGYLLSGLAKKWNKPIAIAVVAFFWEFWHIPFTLIPILDHKIPLEAIFVRLGYTLALSVFLGYLYFETENIWATSLCHCLSNLTTLYLDTYLSILICSLSLSVYPLFSCFRKRRIHNRSKPE